jgi:hypothetical protein
MDEMVDEALHCYERALAVDPGHGMVWRGPWAMCLGF